MVRNWLKSRHHFCSRQIWCIYLGLEMEGKLLFGLLYQGVLLSLTLAWEVRMPHEIHGLKGSCLVIPCSFSFTSYPPTNPQRIVWYQYVSKGYPLVYDPKNPSDVIDLFRGKTDLYQDPQNLPRQCNLVIKHLDLSHHGEKLYAWIDPENVGWRTYRFFDVTSTILVDVDPKPPTISIYGGEMTGNDMKVTCNAFHTCPYSKPHISLKGFEGSDQIRHDHIEDGLWKITLTRTGVVKAERTDIECIVSYYGGITTRAAISKNAKCTHTKIIIEPDRADLTEGVAKDFTCTINHSCLKDPPNISWNYKNMVVSTRNGKLSEFPWATSSTITFIGTKEDHGKILKCTAKTPEGNIESSVIIGVQQTVNLPQNPILFQDEAEAMTFDPKKTGLYIMVPSLFILLLICIIFGIVTYKRRHGRSPDCVESERRCQDVHLESPNKTFSKPYIPSPKSQRNSCSIEDYENCYRNMEDDNMYGNI